MQLKNKYNIFKVFKDPFLFVIIMWIVKSIEYFYNLSFIRNGVFPRDFSGLQGVLTSPFIHKNIEHLLNNTLPIIILGGGLCFFYKKNYRQIFLWLFFASGILLWGAGRPSYHIGASGVIYSLASFIFFSGLISKNPRLSAVSLIVIFIYGSLFWGLFPTQIEVSWEGHLSGFIAGMITSWFYRKEGPERKKYQWEIDEELEKLNNDKIKVIYEYIEK
jgi:membrane associated rhomboid family serine protease|tara:strand:- start:666 stop:1319 length:654 start_codon:yes stop_codon:yes gene_type:complete